MLQNAEEDAGGLQGKGGDYFHAGGPDGRAFLVIHLGWVLLVLVGMLFGFFAEDLFEYGQRFYFLHLRGGRVERIMARIGQLLTLEP